MYLFDLILLRFSLLLLNICMTDDEYRLRQATLDWMMEKADSYTHALTLTMKQSRRVMTQRGEVVERLTTYSATTNMRHFINRLNARLYGNAAKAARGGKGITLLGALEGGATGNNIHYHCVIGRLPERLTNKERDGLIRAAWQQTHFGNEQVNIQALKTTGWMSYMVKELGKLSCDIIDWENVRD